MKLKTLIPALLCASGIASAKSPVETYGDLSIKNAKLVDSTGSPVTLRGMSLFWHMHEGGKDFYSSSVVKYQMTNWNSSVIRAAMGIKSHTTTAGQEIQAYDKAPAQAKTRVQAVVNGAIEAGCYVIVDWHAHERYQDLAVAFFGEMAKTYGNTPNIIWEIWNEPTQTIDENYVSAVATEIRKYSDNVIVVGSSEYSSNPQNTYGSVDSKFKNIAYSIHFYSDHDFWGRIKTAMDGGHAVFSTEWGMSASSGNGGFVGVGSGNIGSWISTMNTAGVSHVNWHLGNATVNGGGVTPETSAALNVGVKTNPVDDPSDPAKGWVDADLTASGKEIRAYLRSKNPKWTLSDTTTRLKKALSITTAKKTDFILGTDTVAFAAGFSKSVPWTLALVGKASGAKRSYTGTGSNVAVVHAVNLRAIGSAAWQAGETVDATLSPVGAKVSYALSTTSNSVHLTRLHETRIRWEGSRIYMPDGLISASAPVRVVIRNAQGQILWQKSASMGTYGWVELSEAAPRFSSVQFIEVHSDEAIVRSSWAPSL